MLRLLGLPISSETGSPQKLIGHMLQKAWPMESPAPSAISKGFPERFPEVSRKDFVRLWYLYHTISTHAEAELYPAYGSGMYPFSYDKRINTNDLNIIIAHHCSSEHSAHIVTSQKVASLVANWRHRPPTIRHVICGCFAPRTEVSRQTAWPLPVGNSSLPDMRAAGFRRQL